MATDSGNPQYTYGVNDALAVKIWAKKLFVEALKQTLLDKFIGTGNDAAIQVKDDLSKTSGDKLTYSYEGEYRDYDYSTEGWTVFETE